MEVSKKVTDIIAESLYLSDSSTVTLQSKLIEDLGAESIDFLDILFRLEKTFGVKIPKGELERQAREGLAPEEFAVNGVLQPKGLERLQALMPEVAAEEWKPGLKLHQLPQLYTVETFVSLVNAQLGQKAASITPRDVPLTESASAVNAR